MSPEDLRILPAFAASWPNCRDALMEYLGRRLLAMASSNSQESGTQTIAKLIQELEKLDAEPRPLRSRSTMKTLNSDRKPIP